MFHRISLFSVLFVLLITSCAPSTPIITATVTPSQTPTPQPTTTIPATETPTLTPEPTNTPQKTYNCPTRLDLEAQLSQLSLKGDIQTGDFARWVMSLPQSTAKISENPQNLDYKVSAMADNKIHSLYASSTTKPGYVAKHSTTVALCKIDPKEFGLENKNNGNTFIVATIMEDKSGRRAPQIMLASRRLLERWGQVWFDDPGNGFAPVDVHSYWNSEFILIGTKPQGPDDLRDLDKGDVFYGAQGTTLEEVNSVFQKLADTDSFSDDVIEFFSTTVFHIGPSRFYVP